MYEDKEIQERIALRKKIFSKITKERLLEIANALHLWIFKNCTNEWEIYEELGLNDEENFLLGYGGSFSLEVDKDDKDGDKGLQY